MPNAAGADTLPPPSDPLPAVATIELDHNDTLGDDARMMLQHWMGRHGTDVEELLWAAITLNYESTYEVASDLAQQVEGAQSDLDDLGAEVSAQFHAMRDEYEQRLALIIEAATKRDAGATGEAFSSMTTTCMRCHQAYLNLTP
jgi:cytochrome c556